MSSACYDAIDRQLLNDFQSAIPLSPRPYQGIAEQLGISESEAIERLRRLTDSGTISRVGPVFRPKRVGVSTLAAIAVPRERLDDVAAMVSSYAEVNHNYERARELLTSNMDKLHAMSAALMKYETIDSDQIDDIMSGRTPRVPKDWDDDDEESGSGGAEAPAGASPGGGSTGDGHIGGPAGEH